MKLSITQKILIPVVVLMGLGFTLVSLIGYNNIRNEIREVMEVTNRSNLTAIQAEIQSANSQTEFLKKALNENFIRITKSIGQLLLRDPGALSTQRMQDLAQSIGVEEIHVVDGSGVLFAGSVPGFFGFDFNTSDQTKPFIPLIDQPGQSIAQDAQARGVDGVLFQYVTVGRYDAPGLVQIGVAPRELQSLL